LSTSTLIKHAVEDLLSRDKLVEEVAANVREIYRAGDRVASIYYVQSGMVKLTEDCGGEGATLGVVGPGEVFGEEILLGYGAYRTNAVRIVKGNLLRIPSPLFQRVASRHPELWRGVAGLLHQRLLFEQRCSRRLANENTDERIAAMLEHLAVHSPLVPGGMAGVGPDGEAHAIPLTQAELAVMVGASRETTSSALNAMARRGALELRRGRILVPPVVARGAHA
jgi:CRP/FNR family cyclic AMP-dependent transcriptional regulator